MQVFYVNIGGGEPTVRADFWELVDYATAHHVGVKFSTNGVRIDPGRRGRLAASDYVDVQISLDGATADVNDAVRGTRLLRDGDPCAGEPERRPDSRDAKISVVVTRHNVDQLDDFKALADRYGATLRITRLRPSGRGADVWDELHPTAAQQRDLYDWLVANGDGVLTGDSFFHLSAFGEALPGLNLCGAGRVVCLIDPVGDVYACPFAIHEQFLAGNILRDGGFAPVWRDSELFTELRAPQTGGACAKCASLRLVPRRLHGGQVLHRAAVGRTRPECVQRLRRVGTGGRTTRGARSRPLDHSRVPPADPDHAAPRAGVRRRTRCARTVRRGVARYGQNTLVRDRRRGAAARDEAAAQESSTARWSRAPSAA